MVYFMLYDLIFCTVCTVCRVYRPQLDNGHSFIGRDFVNCPRKFYSIFSDYFTKDQPHVLISPNEEIDEKKQLVRIHVSDYEKRFVFNTYIKDLESLKKNLKFKVNLLESDSETVKNINN